MGKHIYINRGGKTNDDICKKGKLLVLILKETSKKPTYFALWVGHCCTSEIWKVEYMGGYYKLYLYATLNYCKWKTF